jgi:hypothetical protein
MSETVTETVADRSIHEEVRDEEEDDEEEDLFCLWSAAAEDNSVQIKVRNSMAYLLSISRDDDAGAVSYNHIFYMIEFKSGLGIRLYTPLWKNGTYQTRKTKEDTHLCGWRLLQVAVSL